MTLAQNLAGITKVANVVRKTNLPLTADLQDGYDDVGQTIEEVIKLGVVGCNLEDVDCKAGKLRGVEDAVSRIKTALEAAAKVGVPEFAVNVRTDVLGFGGKRGGCGREGEGIFSCRRKYCVRVGWGWREGCQDRGGEKVGGGAEREG